MQAVEEGGIVSGPMWTPLLCRVNVCVVLCCVVLCCVVLCCVVWCLFGLMGNCNKTEVPKERRHLCVVLLC